MGSCTKFHLLLHIVFFASSLALAEETNSILNNPSKTSSDSRKDYYWKLWAKLIFGCIALVFACCKCCRQCQKNSDDDEDDDVIKNDRELRVYCDLCKEECLNPWHTHDFYCKAIKASTSIGTTYERLNIPLSDLKCPKCIHGYLGLRPPDVIPIDSRFKFVCDLKEKVPENHVRIMNFVEGNEEKNQFTCMNCMCNLCLRCVRDMKLRNRPLKIVQWFHLGDESRLFDNFRRSEVKDNCAGSNNNSSVNILQAPPSRYGFDPCQPPQGLYHHALPMDLPPYLPREGSYLSAPPPPVSSYPSSSPNEGYPTSNPPPPPPPPAEEPPRPSSSNLLLISDLQKTRAQRMKGLNRSWSIMYPDSYPDHEPTQILHNNNSAHSQKKRGPLNRSLSVSTDFVAGKKESSFDDDIFNRHPKSHKTSSSSSSYSRPPITRSVSSKKITSTTHEEEPSPLPPSLRPLPSRRGPLNRSLTIIESEEPPSTAAVKAKRSILNRSASMSTQQLAKASNALENERRAFEATFIKKMDVEEELDDVLRMNSSYGDLTSEDSRHTGNEEEYSKGSSSINNGGIKRNRPKLRAQFSTDELDVRRVVCQSRNEKRYNNNNNSSGSNGGVPGFSAINV